MNVAFAFHIIGIICWLGGMLVIGSYLKDQSNIDQPFIRATKRAWYGYALPGLIVALASGTYQFISRGGSSFYMHQGWFHGKLGLLVVLFVCTVLLGREVGRVTRGEAPNRKIIRLVHGLAGFSFVAIVFLTFLGRV